jgi:hypothetical protein
LQDEIEVWQASVGEFDAPDWERESLDTVRGLLNALAAGAGGFATGAFGSREEVDPIRHLIATAAGRGGNPPAAATYVGKTLARNDGKVPHALTVGEVPVDGFWSLTVYNGDGFMEYNELDSYSFNNVTADRNNDGGITIRCGGCEDGRSNCIPIMDDWNHVVRLYRPRKEMLEGSWEFPVAVPVNWLGKMAHRGPFCRTTSVAPHPQHLTIPGSAGRIGGDQHEWTDQERNSRAIDSPTGRLEHGCGCLPTVQRRLPDLPRTLHRCDLPARQYLSGRQQARNAQKRLRDEHRVRSVPL